MKPSLKDLKSESEDVIKILAWLDSIGEYDEDCRKELIEQCKKDNEVRKYFVRRWEEKC